MKYQPNNRTCLAGGFALPFSVYIWVFLEARNKTSMHHNFMATVQDLAHQYSPDGFQIAESDSESNIVFDSFTMAHRYSCATTGYYRSGCNEIW